MTPLARAAAAVDKHRFVRALGPLLEVWAETHAPEIAVLLDRLTARFTRGPVFAARANLETQHARWLALAATRDPADVPRLLATVAAGPFKHACARIAVRSVRGASPAIAGYLAHERTPPLTLEVLGLDGDPGSLATLVRDPGALANLHTLAIEGVAVPIADLAQSPLRALQRLEVVTMLSHVGRWLQSIETTSITELTITNDPKITCVRELGGSWLIDIPVVDWNANLAGNLAAGLAAIPDAEITVANTDARYLEHVKRALGDRVTYR